MEKPKGKGLGHNLISNFRLSEMSLTALEEDFASTRCPRLRVGYSPPCLNIRTTWELLTNTGAQDAPPAPRLPLHYPGPNEWKSAFSKGPQVILSCSQAKELETGTNRALTKEIVSLSTAGPKYCFFSPPVTSQRPLFIPLSISPSLPFQAEGRPLRALQ